MKKLSNAFKFSFSKKDSPHQETNKNNNLETTSTSVRRFSEPADYDCESRKSEISDNMPSLFERSIKVMFPKQGSASDYENALRSSLVNLPDIVNIGIKDRKAIVLFYTPESCQDALPVLQSSLGSEFKIKRMSSNSVGGERDSMVRNSSSRKNSLTQSPPRVERSSSVDKSEQRTPVPLRTKDAQLNVIVSPQVISNDNLTSVSTGPATSVSTTPSTDDAESTGDKKSIWKSALSRMGIRSSRSLSVSGGSTLARLQLSDDRVVVNPATDSAAPSPYNRDSNVSGLTDGTPFTAMSPNDSLAEPFSPGPVRRSVPVNIPVSKSNSKQNQPDFQTWNSEFKISGSDSDRDEIPMPSDSFIRKSMEVSVSSPHSIETDNAVKTNGISPVRVSTHSHLQSLSAKAPVTSVHSEINTDIDRGDVIRTSQVSQLKDDESVIKQARNRPKPSEPKMSKDEQFLTDNSTNNIVSVASNCSEEFTMADLYSTAAKTVERLNNGEKVDSSGPVNNSRFSLVLSDALKQKPAVIEKDNLELLHEQEKIAHHKRLGIHMVHTEHLLPLREPGPDYISSPQTTHPSGVSDYDQDAQSHISEKMSHYSQIGGVFRRSPSGRSIKGGAGRGAGLAYSHSAKKPGTTATTSDPNMSPVKPPRDGSEYKSPSPNSRDKLDFPFSPFTITKEDLAAMQAAEASECSPLSVTKQPQSQTQKQDASVTPRPDKPNRSRATSTDELFSPSQFLNPDESLHSLSQYAISPMTEEKRMYTQGTRIQLHDEQSPSGAVQRSDAEVQVEVEVTGSTEEVSKLRLMVQVLEAQAKVRCVERDEAEAEFDEKNQKLQAQLSQLESRNHDFEHLIELLRAEVTSVKEIANQQQLQADAEKKKHKAEMVELESTYESCTNDWESRSQISEARVSVLTQELAAIKSEQQCDHEKSTQLHNTVVALTTQMAEIAAANERLRLSVQAKDNDISQLKDSVANLSAEKFELSTQLEAALKCNHISSEVIGTKAHTDTTLSIDTETTTATAAEPSATELPSVAPETGTGSTVNNNSTPTHHVFHYVPHNSVEYSDQSWNEYVPPPSSTNAHAETYHHLYHAPPPRYTSPARFQSSAQVSSSLTARELATLMARSSSSRPSSRYASPLRRSYAPDFGESIGVGPVSHIDEIRMKLDILKSLTNQKIVAQRRPVMRVEREHFTPNVSFNDGLMSYYDNLRASLET